MDQKISILMMIIIYRNELNKSIAGLKDFISKFASTILKDIK